MTVNYPRKTWECTDQEMERVASSFRPGTLACITKYCKSPESNGMFTASICAIYLMLLLCISEINSIFQNPDDPF